MSFLNLRKLVSQRLKLWKSLTNKLQTKIGKLKRSKAIRIEKKKSCKRLKKLRWPFEKKVMKAKHHALIHLNRVTPQVYVDPLLVKESMSSPVAAMAKESNFYRGKTRKEATSSVRSDDDDDDDNSEINEMAEEFITRFRAQMHHHEMLARYF